MQIGENPLDAPLLRALLALLEERGVTRAATRLGLSQPATSQVLKRLRGIFGDQLLVRARNGMVLTDRARALCDEVRDTLARLDGLLAAPGLFDAARTRQVFTVAMPDHVSPTRLGGVIQEFRRQAPHARLVMRALGPQYDFEDVLASGLADIVVSNWPRPPGYLRRSVLFTDQFVCLVDGSHPFARAAPSVQDYLAARHAAPDDYSIAHRGVVELHLSHRRMERDRTVVAGFFSMIPYLIVGTDLVFTTTRHFAEHYAGILPLVVLPSPVEYPPVEFYQLWHESLHASPSHRWLRQIVGCLRPPGVGRDRAPGNGLALSVAGHNS